MPKINDDLDAIWLGAEEEEMQRAIRHFEPNRRFKPMPEASEPPPLAYTKTQAQSNDLYPMGSRVKVSVDSVSPFVEYTLDKNSLVTVESIEVKGKITRVICKDHKGVLWSLLSRDVERVEEDPEKIGRFRLLD